MMNLLICIAVFTLFVAKVQSLSENIANHYRSKSDTNSSNTTLLNIMININSSITDHNIQLFTPSRILDLEDNYNVKLQDIKCLPPMILYTGKEDTPEFSCLPNNCCLPCPLANTFYPENLIETIYSALSAVRVVSFACIFILVISYLILPNKREHPAITVLLFNASLLLFLGVTFFYIGNHKKVQCYDEITPANMINSPFFCGVQGLILVFSTFLLILWCLLLIIHLHCQTVWKSNITQIYSGYFYGFILIVAIVFTILPGITGNISYEVGAVCLVTSTHANDFFFYPLAVFVLPGFLIHIWTVTYITMSHWSLYKPGSNMSDSADTYITTTTSTSRPTVSFQTSQEVVRILKIQWRALLLAMIFLITFLTYWAYEIVEISKLKRLYNDQKPEWVSEWLACIIEGNGQNHCSEISVPHIPNVVFMIISESLTASLGITVFLVFGTCINLWTQWKAYFINRFGGLSDDGGTSTYK